MYRDSIILCNNIVVVGFFKRLYLVATKKRAMFCTFLLQLLLCVAFFYFQILFVLFHRVEDDAFDSLRCLEN
jgi:hypothetical protein